jgi:hypothetical protein
MARMLSSGATGADVVDLQLRLNSSPPTQLAPLSVDGIFGPKTRARVVEFQTNNGLVADGIVGPKTWAALQAGVIVFGPPRNGIDCGTNDPANRGMVSQIAHAFGRALVELGLIPEGAAFNPFGGGGLTLPKLPNLPGLPSLPSLPSLPTFRRLTAGEEATARSVFANSIDFTTVFISDKSGAGNRPFTAAIPVPATLSTQFAVNGIVQVMNLGSSAASPKRDLLIHELTHVWQSQHAANKLAFMANSVACQGAAVAANLAVVANALSNLDLATANAIRSHKDFPGFFPFSAYAHIRGNPFSSYAAEQIANQVEHGVTSIVSHVSSVAAGAVDAGNTVCLGNNTNIEDVRLSTVTP